MAKRARPLRVLHVIGGLQLGGAETLLYRLVTRPGSEVRHEVVCLGDRDWYSSRLEEQGIPVHHLGAGSSWSLIMRLGRVRRLIRDRTPDVIQSWMYLSNMLSSLFARSVGIPVVWGVHASTLEHVGLPSRLCAYAGGVVSRWWPSFVINCSEKSAEIHAKLGYSRAPGAVIQNGYDPQQFFPDEARRQGMREALGIPAGTFVIGSVARWHSQKDIPNLLAATRLLRDGGLPVLCLLIGRGLDEKNTELRTAIRSAGCAEVVRPLGARADTPVLVRAMDLHVLASSGGEAFPNVVAETMLSGTPNVATNVGDSGLMAGATGWIVEPGKAQALACAIEQAFREWMDQPEAWAERRAAARQSIVDRFTFDRMARAYEEIWERVAAASR